MPDLRILVFGGCDVRAPLRFASGRQRSDPSASRDDAPRGFTITGLPFFTHTFGEMLQAIACYRGDKQIPPELHAFCNKTHRDSPTPANSPLDRSDVTIIEPNTSHEVEFEGYYINRLAVWRLLGPLRSLDLAARRLCSQWYDKGIVALDEEARRDATEALVARLPEAIPDRELTAAILRGARGRKREVREGMAAVVKALDMPLGVVAFTWAYMADGRAISWPAEFRRQVIDAACELRLPAFETHKLVQRAGVDFALKPDLRHYTDEFMLILVKPLIQFAYSIASVPVA